MFKSFFVFVFIFGVFSCDDGGKEKYQPQIEEEIELFCIRYGGCTDGPIPYGNEEECKIFYQYMKDHADDKPLCEYYDCLRKTVYSQDLNECFDISYEFSEWGDCYLLTETEGCMPPFK